MHQTFDDSLLDILTAHPGGISEFQLLRRLQKTHAEGFPATLFKESRTLFHAHFLLFNALYRLRGRLLEQRQGILDIDALSIVLHPYRESPGGLPAQPDPLADYYLDSANLRDTSAGDLERMLGQFWARYFANRRRADALGVMGLSDPVDAETVTRCYRRLAMRHHPDRGGDKERFQAIQEAMDILRRC